MIGTHFTGIILAQGKARFAPQCPTLQAKRNAALRQKNPGRPWHETGHRVRSGVCPMLKQGAAHRACPNGRFDAMKWVSITVGGY